ncbi:MAG: hybrid sensor histidine kinase/response regulator, partial [bacterium]
LLSMSGLTGKVEANINRIHQAGLHLLNLINEILDISRIETGNLNFSLEQIDLQDLLYEVGDLVRPMATELNVTLRFQEKRQPGLEVLADKQRLRQVFLNLASNGIKYNRDGGTLTIYFERTSDNRVQIVFQNTGEGIPESKLKRLFQPFDRLDAESHHCQIQGTGLGLALSKNLTEAMGGKIWVRSIMGEETQFFVELGFNDETGPEDETFQQVESLSKKETRKSDAGDHRLLVLYVEDNPDNLALIEQLVELREGVKMISAIQGRQGYDLARQHVPDLIFLDLNLSDINGDEVLHLLKSDPTTKQIPVYMLSADAVTSQIKRLNASGAVDFLTKPIDISKFHGILDEILSS